MENKKIIKLSPSTLGLFKECPRCFWLQMNKGVHRPRGIFPSLPGGVDNVLKDYFDQYRKIGKLPPEIDGQVDGKLFDNRELLGRWRNNWQGARYFDEKLDALLRGALDDCLKDGVFLIPLDYKTRGYALKEDSTSYYQHQLDIYCFLLEKEGHKVRNFAYLVFYYPHAVEENGVIRFEVKPKKVETSTKRAYELFSDAVKLLEGPEPQSHSECTYCTWGIEAFGE